MPSTLAPEMVSLSIRIKADSADSAAEAEEMGSVMVVALTCGCIVIAVCLAALITFCIFKLTWKKKKLAMSSDSVPPIGGLLPNNRVARSLSRQISLIPPEQQLYEGLTPEKREILEALRSQNRRPGAAGFLDRRAMSLAPPGQIHNEPITCQENLANLIQAPRFKGENDIANIRRYSCLPTKTASSAITPR